MLNIRSLNAACYISAITGLEAGVIAGDSGLNHFEFPKTSEVMEAYNDYRVSTRGQSELSVDLTEFNHYIRKYKKKTRGR